MLVSNKRYDEGDVVTFKLINGDEIVAKVKEQADAEFVLNKPCTVLPSAKGIGLVQSLFTAGDSVDVRIRVDHVIMHAPVVKEVQNHYIQVTTGIQPVTSGSIVV
jgi:hypothetical protein